ncbi:hypothetical protein GF377_03755, partial [candidate division GN15 bacterium]|nr:hypothetical protein [candidate division GN15 bacterium]
METSFSYEPVVCLLSAAVMLAVGGFLAPRGGRWEKNASDTDQPPEQALIEFFHDGIADASADQLADNMVRLVHDYLGGRRVLHLAAHDDI